jgi:hypothetical protein
MTGWLRYGPLTLLTGAMHLLARRRSGIRPRALCAS